MPAFKDFSFSCLYGSEQLKNTLIPCVIKALQ